jgi:uncharacterized protein (DUF488 family)
METKRAGTVYTIGHSAHTQERFIDLLQRHRITAISDVRSMPYSRVNPQFNQRELKEALLAAGILYVFLGKELGARSSDPGCYVDGKVQYCRLAQTSYFQHGIERVMTGMEKHRIALMCAEKEPLDCHRTILVARSLVAAGVELDHILGNGSVESHDETMVRLMRQLGSLGGEQEDMFRSPKELLDEAYERQEKRIAYIRPPKKSEQESAYALTVTP